MSLVVFGSMAFDALETPFGKTDKIIGGAATYISWAATNFSKVKIVSVVGGDFPIDELTLLEKRGCDISGVQIVKDQKSFFWKGKYHLDMNSRDTIETQLNVISDYKPVIPESYKNSEYLLLGNWSPALQLDVLQQFHKKPKLVATDTMGFWMDTAMDDLKKVLRLTDVLMINDSEARQLSGEFSLVKAAHIIREMGPKYLVIKKGEHGALLFHGENVFVAPALPLAEVFDPTGAGDTFAGGFMGHIAKSKDISFENMKTSVIIGSAIASFSVEKFGTQRLRELSQTDIDKRLEEFVELVNFDIDLV